MHTDRSRPNLTRRESAKCHNVTVFIVRNLALLAALLLVAAALPGNDTADWDKRMESGRNFWAFQPVGHPEAPQTSSDWVRTPIDSFILDELQKAELEPSPDASKQRLLRRVYLDLIGLPPTPEEAAEFLNDAAPRAYENLVERLLASPHYGERWALKWLDVVRYADTDGFERDGYREHGWRYRDYVVRSFNADKPYDRFVQEQLAGDELFPYETDALIATGFNGAGPRHIVGGNQDKEEARQEVLTEMAAGVGQVFLGLTVQCARCHDHKFDPIAQADYYRLQSFFAATELADLNTASVDELLAYEAAVEAHEQRLAPIKKQLKAIEDPYRAKAQALKKANLAAHFQAALRVPKEQRNAEQERLAKEAQGQIKPMWYEAVALIPFDVKATRRKLRERMHSIELERPDPAAGAYASSNADEAPVTHILKIGDYRHKQEPVDPAFLSVLDRFGVDPEQSPKGRRASLARWLTSPEHPLTARVMVNRIWEFRMGAGFVADPNNFGLLGGLPTHPELLDFLTRRFIDLDWSIKSIDRMIVLSSAYRQAADTTVGSEHDPDNKLYWRANRKRLEGEVIRDSVLVAAGRLNRSLGGKPVLLPIEREVYDLIFTEAEPDNLWPVTPDESQHRRRSLYLLNRRTVRLPFLTNFDQPDTMTSCAVRSSSTHALQALTMINGRFMQSESKQFADRLQTECDSDIRCLVEHSYQWTLAREPSAEERRMAEQFLARDEAQLSDYALAMLNRNEFVYRP